MILSIYNQYLFRNLLIKLWYFALSIDFYVSMLVAFVHFSTSIIMLEQEEEQEINKVDYEHLCTIKNQSKH